MVVNFTQPEPPIRLRVKYFWDQNRRSHKNNNNFGPEIAPENLRPHPAENRRMAALCTHASLLFAQEKRGRMVKG
jgi:hypothetical protein